MIPYYTRKDLHSGALDTRYLAAGDWTTLALTAGWEDYDAGALYQTARVRKVGDLVYVQGMVKRTSGTSLIVATLPANYRPPLRLVFNTEGSGGTQRIDVAANGQIIVPGSTSTAFLSITFPPFSVL